MLALFSCKNVSFAAWGGSRRAVMAMVLFACASSAYAQSDAVLRPDTIQARVAACTACHGEQGRAGADGYYPRLAGKPQDYLFNQLLNFRDGQRQYRPMTHLLSGLPNDYLYEIAGYFADQHVPYPEPARADAPKAVLERGQMLALQGDVQRKLPACTACHGASLGGVAPAVPGLLGLPRDYISAQIGSWRNGLRRAAAPDCMAEIAHKLKPEDIAALAAWLSTRPVPQPYLPELEGSITLPLECGSLTQR